MLHFVLQAKGISYDYGDFKIRVGNMSQGNNFRGVITEVKVICLLFSRN